MEGRYEGTMVIKPCVEDPIVVNIRTTALESVNPVPYKQDNPFRARTTTWEGNCWEEIMMSALMSEDSAKFLCADMMRRIEQMTWLTESKSGKDVEYLKYKIENFYPIKIAQHYYSNQVMSCQTAMSLWIECGEYLVELSGTSDLTMIDGSIRDIKYYSAQFGDSTDKKYDIYTIDNYKDSILRKKYQWFIYPILMGYEGTAKFFYDLYPKSKNAPSKKNPDNYLKRHVYECEVDIDKAKEELKRVIVKYFRECKSRGVEIGSYLND